jgi:hypothetical protein
MKGSRKRKIKEPPLQALRIPTGWLVEWNTFFDVEPKFKSYDHISWHFGEDMLLVSNDRVGVAIDVGWYPAHRTNGSFGLVAVRIYEDGDRMSKSWDVPLRKIRTRSKEKVVRTLEGWLEWYGNQKTVRGRKN